jgi:DNA-binding NarL/FixJ family response regulator
MKIALALSSGSATERLALALRDHGHAIVQANANAKVGDLFENPEADLIVVSYDLLAAVYEARPGCLTALGRNVPIVVALAGDDLRDDRPLLPFGSGWIFLDDNLDRVAAAIALCASGYSMVPDAVAARLARHRQRPGSIERLTLLECAVLHELALGRNEDGVARRLGTPRTVIEMLLRTILAKLMCESVAELRAIAQHRRSMLNAHRQKLMGILQAADPVTV